MLTKNEITATLDQLSDSFTLDEFIDKLIFIEKVKSGLKDSEENKVFGDHETKEKLSKWLK